MKLAKLLTYAIVLLMLSLSFSPIISSARTFLRDKPFSKKITDALETNKEKTVVKTVSTTPLTMSRSPSMIPRYLYLYTNYGGFQQWRKIDRFNYIIQKLRNGNKGIPVDINDDGKNNLLVKPSLKPLLLRGNHISLAYEAKLTITRLPISSNLDDRFFETKLYFFPPKFFSNKLFTIGYRSPEGEQIPESCIVTHTFITQLISKKQGTHTTLHYSCTNPSTRVILLSGESSGDSENNSGWTAVEAGHISLGGNIHMEVNGSFEVEGQEITLRGTFDLTTPHNTVDIWWNTTKGFFKINGTGYFEASDVYFNADNKIEVEMSSLILDADGHLLVDNSGAEGDLSIDGAFEVEDLSFDVDIHQETVTFAGDFDLSSTGEADNLNIIWGETGFAADGSFAGDIGLTINNFQLIYTNFTAEANRIEIHGSVNFDFTAAENVAFCTISSQHVKLTNLHLEYGTFSLSRASLEVTGVLTLTLGISNPNNKYLFAEKGHISISGDANMHVNGLLDINGTQVILVGDFSLKTKYDRVDIWWNTTQGFVKINGTGYFHAENFFLSVENLLSIGLDALTIDTGGYFYLQQSSGRGSLNLHGMFTLSSLTLSSDIANDIVVLKGDLDVSADASGDVEISWSNTGFNVDTGVSGTLSLSLINFSLKYNNTIDTGAALIELQGSGSFKVKYAGALEGLTIDIPAASLLIDDFHLKTEKISASLKHLSASAGGRLYIWEHVSVDIAGSLSLRQLLFKGMGIKFGLGSLDANGNGHLYIGEYISASAEFSLSLAALSLNSKGFSLGIGTLSTHATLNLHMTEASLTLNAGGFLEMSSFYLSVSQTGSLGIGYLFAQGGVDIQSNKKGLQITAGGEIEIDSLSAEAEGFSLGIGYLSAAGGVNLFSSESSLAVSPGGEITIEAFYIGIPGFSASFSYLYAIGNVNMYFGNSISIDAKGATELRSLLIMAGAEGGSGSLQLGSLSASGGFSVGLGSTHLSANAKGRLTLTGFSAYGSLSGVGNGALSLDSFYVTGDVSTTIDLTKGFSVKAVESGSAHISKLIIQGFSAHGGTKDLSLSGGFNFDGGFNLDYDGKTFKANGDVEATGVSFSYQDSNLNVAFTVSLVSLEGGGSATVQWNEKTFSAEASASLTINGLTVTKPIQFTVSSLGITGGGELYLKDTNPEDTEEGETHFHAEISGKVKWTVSGYSNHGTFGSQGQADANGISIDADIITVNLDPVNPEVVAGATIHVAGYAMLSGFSIWGRGQQLSIASINAPSSGTFKVDVDARKPDGRIYLNCMGATWSGIQFTTSQGTIHVGSSQCTGDVEFTWDTPGVTLDFTLKSNKGFSGDGDLSVEGIVSCHVNAQIPSAFTLKASGHAVLQPRFLKIFPSQAYMAIDTGGKPVSFSIETESARFSGSLAANDFTFFFDKDSQLIPKTTGSLEGEGSAYLFDKAEREWVKIWPIMIYGNTWLWGKGSDDNEWKRGEKGEKVEMDEPGKVSFRGYYVLNYTSSGDGNSDNNNDFYSDSTNPTNSDSLVTALTSGGGNNAGVYFQFFYGEGNHSKRLEGSSTTVKGPQNVFTYDAFYAESSFEYTKPGTYTATVEVTDDDGNILGQGSITVEIGVFDVLLEAQGPGTGWESEFCKITDFDENADTVTVNLRAIVDGENDNSNQHSDDIESSESTNTEDNLQVSTLSSSGSYIYHFNFGDGTEWTSKETQSKEYQVSHPYTPHATYTATVTVTDPETGVSNSDSVVIQIGSDLRCHLWVDDDYWAREKTVEVGDTLTFHAKVWYENEDNNPDNNDVSQSNNDLRISTLDGGDVTFTYEIRYDDGTSDVIRDTSSRQISTAHSFSENGTYVVVLLVEDSNGNSDGDAVTIHVGGELIVDVSASPNILIRNGASSTITAKVRKKNSNPVNNPVDNNQQNTYYSNNDIRVSTLDDGGTYRYEFKFGDGATESETSGSSCSKNHPYRTDKLVEAFFVRVDVTEVDTGLTGFGRAVVILVNLNAWLGASPNPVKAGESVTFEARADGPPGNNNNYANYGQNDASSYGSRVTALAGSEEFLYEFSFGDNGGGFDNQPESEDNNLAQNNPTTTTGGFHIHSLSGDDGTVTTLSGQTAGRVAHAHHTYSKPGVYRATVKITHVETGVSDTASVTVVVEGNLTADAGGPYSASKSVTISNSNSGGSNEDNSDSSSSHSSHTDSTGSHSSSGSHSSGSSSSGSNSGSHSSSSSSSSSHSSSSSSSSSTTNPADSTGSTQPASTNTVTTLIWQEGNLIHYGDDNNYVDIDDDGDSGGGYSSGSGGGSGGSKTVSVTIYFDGSGSRPANQITSYIWSFGDGKTGRGRRTSHTYKITVGGGGNGGNSDSTQQNNYNNNFVTALSQSEKTGETVKTGGGSSGSSGGGSRSYDVVKTFRVTLTVKDRQGNLDTDSTTVTITIHVTEKNNGNNNDDNNNDNNDNNDNNNHYDSQQSNQANSYNNNGGHFLSANDNKRGLDHNQVAVPRLLSFILKTLRELFNK